MIFANENDGRDYGQAPQYSNAVANIIDTDVKQIIDQAYRRTLDLLQ